MSIAAVGPGCGAGFLGCIRNGMPASSKRVSNFAASRGAYLPSGTKSVCSCSSDFMRGWDTSNEKEISHGRVSWQTRWTYFAMGVGFIVWLDEDRFFVLVPIS